MYCTFYFLLCVLRLSHGRPGQIKLSNFYIGLTIKALEMPRNYALANLRTLLARVEFRTFDHYYILQAQEQLWSSTSHKLAQFNCATSLYNACIGQNRVFPVLHEPSPCRCVLSDINATYPTRNSSAVDRQQDIP